ncbi:hypothetical protein ON010_g3006 [Phytophthora cinnamomi]|nr:hypothetical protein ON010_g3006 [Phytophthora cinnamomi]
MHSKSNITYLLNPAIQAKASMKSCQTPDRASESTADTATLSLFRSLSPLSPQTVTSSLRYRRQLLASIAPYEKKRDHLDSKTARLPLMTLAALSSAASSSSSPSKTPSGAKLASARRTRLNAKWKGVRTSPYHAAAVSATVVARVARNRVALSAPSCTNDASNTEVSRHARNLDVPRRPSATATVGPMVVVISARFRDARRSPLKAGFAGPTAAATAASSRGATVDHIKSMVTVVPVTP